MCIKNVTCFAFQLQENFDSFLPLYKLTGAVVPQTHSAVTKILHILRNGYELPEKRVDDHRNDRTMYL